MVQTGGAQLFDKDVVCQTQGVGVFLFHFTEDAHAQPRPREGVTVDHVVGQAQFQADLAHFVLEQFAQGLDQLELHVFRQAAYIVVALDHVGLAGLAGGGFDHVRVDGALGQPVGVFQLAGLVVEDIDKGVADNLALQLGIRLAGQFAEEVVFRVHADHFHAHVVGEHFHDLVTFLVTQQAVVDKHASELIADSLVKQRCHHGGIHPAGQAQDHFVSAYLLADGVDGIIDDVARRPQGFTVAQFAHEAL